MLVSRQGVLAMTVKMFHVGKERDHLRSSMKCKLVMLIKYLFNLRLRYQHAPDLLRLIARDTYRR